MLGLVGLKVFLNKENKNKLGTFKIILPIICFFLIILLRQTHEKLTVKT